MKSTTLLKIVRKYIIVTTICLCGCALTAGILWASDATGSIVLGQEPKSVTFSFDEQITEKLRTANSDLFAKMQINDTVLNLIEYSKVLIMTPIKSLLWFFKTAQEIIVSLLE